MNLATDGRVQRALGVVLGVDVSRSATCYLDRQALKTSFRRQAHRLHPDKALTIGLSEQALACRFRELKQAYDYLLALIEAPKTASSILAPSPGRAAPAAAPSERSAAAGKATQASAEAATNASTGGAPHVLRPPGTIPKRRLRFAQYLYYAHVIDWDTLFRAVRWQHRTRPCLGEIAKEIGLLSARDVIHILRHKRIEERFGEAALRLGRLDHVRLLTILGYQHRLDRPIGRYFVEHKLLTRAELNAWLQHNWAHNLCVAAAELGLRKASASGRTAGRQPRATP